jgi:hypothetical protein
MAVAHVQEFPIVDRSTTNYDAIAQRIEAEGTPDGGIIHTAGFDDEMGVFRIFDVWASREQAERFNDEKLMPILKELLGDDWQSTALAPSRDYYYELHDVATD